MKWVKRIAVVCVLLIVVAVAVIYFSLNAIVRSVVQRQASASLGVPTTLGSAQLAIFGGNVQLDDLAVSSPPKFSAPQIFTLGGVAVSVHYGQLTGEPIHIQQITIDKPALVVEQSGGALNLKALMDQMPQTPQTSSGEPTKPIKLVIDELDLTGADVTFMPGIPGLGDKIEVTVPTLTLKNIGNSDGAANGAAIKDVVMQVATA
ncbi:MAG TPA: AsmA family protein, partial [Tepidisphaeraceae bacterium]